MANRYFGDVPAVIPQEVRASPPSPSQANIPPPAPSAQQLSRRRPVRASPLLPPGTIQAGLRAESRMPVAAVLQGMHVGSTVIPQATNINGAPVMVANYERPGSLGNMNIDTSVSARHRAQQKLGALIADGSPVSGNYTDAIRNAAGFAFGPKRLPKQGYSAASYSYPAQQMVVGATLAGTPIVNPQPTRGASPLPAPRLVTRGGSIRGQISSSPSEDRRRMISTLNGLGGAEFKEDDTHIYADSDWFQNTPAGKTRPDYMKVTCYRSVSGDGNANQTFASSCTLSAAAAAAWAKWANDTFPGAAGAEYRRIAKLVPEIAPAPPWSVIGRTQRGLPQDWESIAKKAKDEFDKRRGGGSGGGGGGGAGVPEAKPGVTCKMEGSGFRIRLVCRDAAGNVVSSPKEEAPPVTPPSGSGSQPPSSSGPSTGAAVGLAVGAVVIWMALRK